jgi:amidase
MIKEYKKHDALGLADLVKKKQVTPLELLKTAMKTIKKHNPQINAVVTPMYDLAKKDIKNGLPKGPFHGVPFLLKDLLASYAGVPLTSGCRGYSNYIPDHDSELVKRFKATGVVICGKTNTPEFGIMGVTEPKLHGPTLNPWNKNHTPGGSSGGSGAAVSSQMVPMASAGDGGGSIRIPASCCGIFGMKPSRGRNPIGPDIPYAWQGCVVEHVLTRSVRDSAAMLDATRGSDPGAPYIIKEPNSSYLSVLKKKPQKLKIAFTTTSPLGNTLDRSSIEAVEKAAKICESLGHHVEEATPDLDGHSITMNYLIMNCAESAADIKSLEQYMGHKASSKDVEISTLMLGLLGKAYTAEEYSQSLRDWNRTSREMGRFHQNYDILITPTAANPPAKIGELVPKKSEETMMKIIRFLRLGKLVKISGMVEQMAESMAQQYPFTQIANLTGQPAMSVPLHWSENNLPIGVQFIGDMCREDLLFQLAAQLEKAEPWFDKKPPLL